MSWVPVNLCFIAMLFTGFLSLGTNSVPMVTLFKNLTNMLILFCNWYFDGVTVTKGILLSFVLMLGGAVFAARNDLA